jgi:large subunit ribosomal protein L14e
VKGAISRQNKSSELSVNMGYTRFVEIGRVALINFGEDAGKLCTIVDILDGSRVSLRLFFSIT